MSHTHTHTQTHTHNKTSRSNQTFFFFRTFNHCPSSFKLCLLLYVWFFFVLWPAKHATNKKTTKNANVNLLLFFWGGVEGLCVSVIVFVCLFFLFDCLFVRITSITITHKNNTPTVNACQTCQGTNRHFYLQNVVTS